MTMPRKGAGMANDDSVERILGKATPRPVPSAAETKIVRDNVQAEWIALTRKRSAKRRLSSWAIAATVLVVVFAGFNSVRLNGVSEEQVASIDKRFGSVYMLGENSELLRSNNLSAVVAGQTIVTDADSGIGFMWGEGGSLRVDENSRVEFLSAESVYLRTGRVFYDSKPALMAGAASPVTKLTVVTDQGEVTHIGTQYMVMTSGSTLTISVREGEVRVTNRSSVKTASSGEQMQVQGGAAMNVVNIKRYGDQWQWIEAMAPSVSTRGRSIDEFLQWVSHETGLTVAYGSNDVMADAAAGLLKGPATIDSDPKSALYLWMSTTGFDWKIDDGKIVVDRFVDGPDASPENQH